MYFKRHGKSCTKSDTVLIKKSFPRCLNVACLPLEKIITRTNVYPIDIHTCHVSKLTLTCPALALTLLFFTSWQNFLKDIHLCAYQLFFPCVKRPKNQVFHTHTQDKYHRGNKLLLPMRQVYFCYLLVSFTFSKTLQTE